MAHHHTKSYGRLSMLATLPDECKQLLWGFLDVQELCRVECVARGMAQGVDMASLWRTRAVMMVLTEMTRLQHHKLPAECGLQRQNASRRLDAEGIHRGITASEVVGMERRGDGLSGLQGEQFWKEWYRDFHLSVRAFEAAHSAFEDAKTELQELKRQRADLRELLQALKSKSHTSKNLRRMQMNCVRWMNRTLRRAAANKQARVAQNSALSKGEVQEQLQAIENSVQLQAKMIFSLRSQYQKKLHRLTTEMARGKRVLADLEE